MECVYEMGYHKMFFRRLLYRDNWMEPKHADFLNELNIVADEAYEKGTIEGYIASLLIYHQITEEMIKIILEYSRFFIQCSIYPTELFFKAEKDKMYGYYLNELERTISFEEKDEFIAKCKEINHIRIDIVHKLTQKNSIGEVTKKMEKVKKVFDELYELFSNTQDWFMLCFKDFRKNHDWNDFIDEYEDAILAIKEELSRSEDEQLHVNLQEYEEIVELLKKYYHEK